MSVKRCWSSLLLTIAILFSIIMFFLAPEEYSFSFCVACFVPFVLGAYLLLKNRCKYNLVIFEFIFTIVFFFVNYAYPIFYYPVLPYFSLFHLSFPENYINSGIALATIGYLCYVEGSLKYNVLPRFNMDSTMPCHPFLKHINILLLLLLTIQLLPILKSGIYDGSWGEGASTKAIVDALSFFVAFSFLSKEKSFKGFIKHNKVMLICLCLYVGIITAIGNRGMFMRFALLFSMFLSSFYFNIRKYIVIVVMFFGMFFLYFIGQVRGGGEYSSISDKQVNPILAVGMDLTINNRSLYSLMEYHDKNGINFGKTFLMNILSAVPKGQYVFLKITGWSMEDISSAGLITKDYFDNNPDKELIGLGTNLIGDIYIAFGFLGVIILMYYLGVFVSYSYIRAQNGDILFLLIYCIMFAESIIMARSSYLGIIRPMVWTIACAYLSGYKKSIKHENTIYIS